MYLFLLVAKGGVTKEPVRILLTSRFTFPQSPSRFGSFSVTNRRSGREIHRACVQLHEGVLSGAGGARAEERLAALLAAGVEPGEGRLAAALPARRPPVEGAAGQDDRAGEAAAYDRRAPPLRAGTRPLAIPTST